MNKNHGAHFRRQLVIMLLVTTGLVSIQSAGEYVQAFVPAIVFVFMVVVIIRNAVKTRRSKLKGDAGETPREETDANGGK